MTVAALGSSAAPFAVALAAPASKRVQIVKPASAKAAPAKTTTAKQTLARKPSAKPAPTRPAPTKPAPTKPAPAKLADTAKPQIDPQPDLGAISEAIADEASGALKRFYAERDFRPLWAANGRPGPAAEKLVSYLGTVEFDGLDPDDRTVDRLRARIDAAQSGDPHDVAQAELELSAAFARYVQAQRRAPTRDVIWADRTLRPPRKLAVDAVLRDAAVPDSLDDYVARMGWMSRQYTRLRALNAAASEAGVSPEDHARLLRNMDRARLLPGPWTRHIIVDASSGWLWYYEDGRAVGRMRVVVGAAKTQTPMMVGRVQWAIVNPYWNVPDYLAQGSIARKVLSGRSLADMNMEALSDWSASPQQIDPATIDWQAVADGREAIRVRQLPGPANSMGRVKFLFPNDEGIFLHDTPERDLLEKPDRHFSNGCIRLEKAAELGSWLLQRPLPPVSNEVEQPLPLPASVPVYLTYLTATSGPNGLAFRDDIYDRDGIDAGIEQAAPTVVASRSRR